MSIIAYRLLVSFCFIIPTVVLPPTPPPAAEGTGVQPAVIESIVYRGDNFYITPDALVIERFW